MLLVVAFSLGLSEFLIFPSWAVHGGDFGPRGFFPFICYPFFKFIFLPLCPSFSCQCVSTVASKNCACNHIIFTCRIRFGLWEVIDPLLSNERRKVESLRHSQENCCSLFFFLPGSLLSWSITPEGLLRRVQCCGFTYWFKAPYDLDQYVSYQLYQINKWHFPYPTYGSKCLYALFHLCGRGI